jgi:DUF1680 family protein
LGGILVLQHRGVAVEHPLSNEPLYRGFEETRQGPRKPITLTFIPYYAWANRGQEKMEVWVPYATAGSQ